jgi:putative membrane protein
MEFIGYDLLCTLLFVGVLFMLLYELFSPSSNDGVKESPLDVLRKKYASFEMSTEAYEERKEVLERDTKK